jgi:hypothetical protein
MGIVEYHAFSKNVTFVTCCEILKLAFLLGDCFDAMRFLLHKTRKKKELSNTQNLT